ncbi:MULTISPECIES: ribbon-helix-helix protein, CopG family [unclassified Sphingomonas]|uniref:CopG family ribbon-helix-helix protein n=1 Tax=unclassified Sphingomonas TaxID=196159 RepID=UPI00226A6045|nr:MULTISPECIES: ribbon-helix-helix protein, CopG family [unclassified Sphingomonas]
MNAPASITASLDPSVAAMVEELALARGITREQFVADAIREQAERGLAWRAFVQEGIDAADRGDVISQDEMEAWFEERIAARRQA